MLRLVFVSLFLLGAVIGWLVVYFVRKYKDHNPRGLRDTIMLFLGGGCLDLLLSLIDKQVAIILQSFPEPYISMYCQQFDNFKNVADFFEFAAKLMRR